MAKPTIHLQPITEITFDTNEVLLHATPVNPTDPNNNLVGLIGLEVKGLDILNFTLFFWQEIAILLSLFLIIFALSRFIRLRRLKDIKRGEPYCKKCSYNLSNHTADTCPECGTKHVHSNGKNRKTMGRNVFKKTIYASFIILSFITITSLSYLNGYDIYKQTWANWYQKETWISTRRLALQLPNHHYYSEWAYKFFNAIRPSSVNNQKLWYKFQAAFAEELHGLYKTNNTYQRKLISSTKLPFSFTPQYNAYAVYGDYWQYNCELIKDDTFHGFVMPRMIVLWDGNKPTAIHHNGQAMFPSPKINAWNIIDNQYLAIDMTDIDALSWYWPTSRIAIVDLHSSDILFYDSYNVKYFNNNTIYPQVMVFGHDPTRQNRSKTSPIQNIKNHKSKLREQFKFYIEDGEVKSCTVKHWFEVVHNKQIVEESKFINLLDNKRLPEYESVSPWEHQPAYRQLRWKLTSEISLNISSQFNYTLPQTDDFEIASIDQNHIAQTIFTCDTSYIKGSQSNRHTPIFNPKTGELWHLSRDDYSKQNSSPDSLCIFDLRPHLPKITQQIE
ncbi:hypothetical protein JD969_04080 [Planctomycetota bacterium]|nr:hypothetical protein JD969_04080 [Planctomycetota bacterium]